MNRCIAHGGGWRRFGFTLIELLTVVAIITLLIGLLVPSLSKARDSAKNVKTRATMKAIGDGLELFRNENEKELRGQSYPSSTPGDDPTEGNGPNSDIGVEDMSGAQWLVRYLLGKKLDGYVARDAVPPALQDPNNNDTEQQYWYADGSEAGLPANVKFPLDRRGPYADGLAVKAPRDLPGCPATGTDAALPRYTNPVIVDSFLMPILYYAANSRQADRPKANIATYRGPTADFAGIYTFKDNSLFTGLCAEISCIVQPWDFGGGKHKLTYGPSGWTNVPANPPKWADVVGNYPDSFPYYIMDKGAYDGSNKKTVVPLRKDSFILISPGKDGIFGTKDDVTNFN